MRIEACRGEDTDDGKYKKKISRIKERSEEGTGHRSTGKQREQTQQKCLLLCCEAVKSVRSLCMCIDHSGVSLNPPFTI